MRRALIATLSASLMLTAFGPATASLTNAADAGPGVGGFMSSNISYVATLAADSPGVGGRVHVMPSGERRFYVSSVQGLRIYNIDNPGMPVPIGVFEIANWENEDVSVSKDGKTVLMSEFTGTGYTYIFQVSEPTGPLGSVTISMGDVLPLSASHIVDCIDDACNYFYGAEGQIWDATSKTDVKSVAKGWGDQIKTQLGGTYAFGSGHNVEVVGDYDVNGDGKLQRIVTADTTPIVMMDATDPLTPKLITTSVSTDHTAVKSAYQHNNKIRGFEDYVPRTAAEPLTMGTRPAQSGALPITAPTNLRRGELLIGNGETNFSPRCGGGSGPLTSWSTAGWEKGDKIKPIETFRPVNGTYDGTAADGGNPAAAAIGCSGHWFDVRDDDANADDIIVAAGWYEHGTRVIKVDGKTGAFKQIGFFQPVNGSASAAHWVVDEEFGTFIYTVDYLRGVDIMKYDPEAPLESDETFEQSWFKADAAITQLSAQKRYICSLGKLNNSGVAESTTLVGTLDALRRG